MASRYAEKFAIPEDFPDILRSFTREVLRENPQNIYEFGFRWAVYAIFLPRTWLRLKPSLDPSEKRYFSDLAAQNGEKGLGDLSMEEMRELIGKLFKEADRFDWVLLCKMHLKLLLSFHRTCHRDNNGYLDRNEFMIVSVRWTHRSKNSAFYLFCYFLNL